MAIVLPTELSAAGRLLSELTKDGIFRELRGESDRACGVLAGEILSEILAKLLRSKLIKQTPDSVFAYPAELSTFSSRIKFAYYFGLVSETEYSELEQVRKIRNIFAHQFKDSLSFDKSPIRDHVRNLQYPQLFLDAFTQIQHPWKSDGLTDSDVSEIRDSNRRLFETEVGLLSLLLTRRIVGTTSFESPAGTFDMLREHFSEVVKAGNFNS